MLHTTGWDGKSWILVHEVTKALATVGETVTVRDGYEFLLEGGRAPHKPSSSGKVWVRPLEVDGLRHSQEYYPCVVGLEWVPIVSEAEA